MDWKTVICFDCTAIIVIIIIISSGRYYDDELERHNYRPLQRCFSLLIVFLDELRFSDLFAEDFVRTRLSESAANREIHYKDQSRLRE